MSNQSKKISSIYKSSTRNKFNDIDNILNLIESQINENKKTIVFVCNNSIFYIILKFHFFDFIVTYFLYFF